jgi:hypothetical protein
MFEDDVDTLARDVHRHPHVVNTLADDVNTRPDVDHGLPGVDHRLPGLWF